MKRIFIAIKLPNKIKDEIANWQNELIKLNLPVRWVKKENIHLTLVFLGEIREEKIENVKEICKKIIPKYQPFALKLKNMGVFPNQKRPQIIWIGLKNHQILLNLQKDLNQSLRQAGFTIEDREFLPHLTIGRIKGKLRIQNLTEKFNQVNLGSFEVKSVDIMESELLPEGPVHRIIEKLILGSN